MIDLLSGLQVILREAGFETRLLSSEGRSVVCFENDLLTGFGFVFDDVASLLMEWQAAETALLVRYAASLRSAGPKAWNVYSLFVCAETPDPERARRVAWLEEDLERTRKIAGCGLTSREDLYRALLPILPLQYQASLGVEDMLQRLRTQVDQIAPKAGAVLFDEDVPALEIVRLLGERS